MSLDSNHIRSSMAHELLQSACLDSVAAEAAKLLMTINAKEATSRHAAAATSSALFSLLVKESKASITAAEVKKSLGANVLPSEGYAWQLRMSADRIQKCIADSLQCHCTSMRDAIFVLKRNTTVADSIWKHLVQLNAAETLLKHSDTVWLQQLEDQVYSLLADGSQVAKEAEPFCADLGAEEFCLEAEFGDSRESWKHNSEDICMDSKHTWKLIC